MKRLVLAAAAAFAAGYLARSELHRLRPRLRPRGRLLRDAEAIARVIGPGERYEALTAVTSGPAGSFTEYRKHRSAAMPAVAFRCGPVPDDASSLEAP